MNVIKVKDSYRIWDTKIMDALIHILSYRDHDNADASRVLNRSYKSMYFEWYLHNVGYYVTLPLRFIKPISKLNDRLRDVDLEEWL